jgi:hypothetical protein
VDDSPSMSHPPEMMAAMIIGTNPQRSE